MNEPTNKVELLAAIISERKRLQSLIASLSEVQMTAPTLEGGWAVKDVMPHIVDWEQYVVRLLQACARGERPAPRVTSDADIDGINRKTFETNRDRPLGELRAEFDRSYQEIWLEVEALSDADLFDLDRRVQVAGSESIPVWNRIAINTCFHYDEHSAAIEAWLQKPQV